MEQHHLRCPAPAAAPSRRTARLTTAGQPGSVTTASALLHSTPVAPGLRSLCCSTSSGERAAPQQTRGSLVVNPLSLEGWQPTVSSWLLQGAGWEFMPEPNDRAAYCPAWTQIGGASNHVQLGKEAHPREPYVARKALLRQAQRRPGLSVTR